MPQALALQEAWGLCPTLVPRPWLPVNCNCFSTLYGTGLWITVACTSPVRTAHGGLARRTMAKGKDQGGTQRYRQNKARWATSRRSTADGAFLPPAYHPFPSSQA